MRNTGTRRRRRSGWIPARCARLADDVTATICSVDTCLAIASLMAAVSMVAGGSIMFVGAEERFFCERRSTVGSMSLYLTNLMC